MKLERLQNKKALGILGLIIIALICVPLVLLAAIRYTNGYTIERVYYRGHEDIVISGIIYRPNTDLFPGERPGIICLHDFWGTKETVDRFSEDLVRAGFVILAYDLRGFGNSEGVSHLGDPDYEIEDLKISIAYLKTLPYVNASKIGITGIGYGGALSIMSAGILKEDISASFAMNAYVNLTETFMNIELNSMQGNLMRTISKYLGYIPHLFLDNELTEEQFRNIKGFIDLVSDIPSMAKLDEIILLENNILRFNQTILKENSPINSVYASQIPNNSLFLAAGQDDQIYPYSFSKTLNGTLFSKYNLNTDYYLFSNAGHNLETTQVDCALVNFFNLKLRDLPLPNNNVLMNPYVPESEEVLVFKEPESDNLDVENIFLGFFTIIDSIPLAFLIPFLLAISLIYLLILLLFTLKQDLKVVSFKKKKESKKEYKEIFKSKKVIVRRIEKKKIVAVPDEKIKEEIDKSSFLYDKKLGMIFLVFTSISLILIPTIGMTYININLFLILVSMIILNLILCIIFFSKFETWDWKKNINNSSPSSISKKRKREDIDNDKDLSNFVEKFIYILKKNPFYQILFYLTIVFLVVLFIAFVISPLELSLIDFGLNQIFSTLMLASVILTLVSFLLIWGDRKYFNLNYTLKDYGFGFKQILKGFSFSVLIVQIPLIILIIASFILIIPQPFLSESYEFVFLAIPFIFLYFFGFEVIFRGLILKKIEGNKWGEFIIGTLFYAQFMAIFSYLIFMNSYNSTLVFYGIPISYSGLFGIIFVIFSLIGTFNYIITRTPIAPSISNTLILFFLLAVLI